MDSPDPAERKWACVAVSNLIQNDPSTRRLLQGKNVVGALITRLTDSEEQVVVDAAGSLRCVCPLQILIHHLEIYPEIYVLTADMTSVQRCTIKIYSFPGKLLFPRCLNFRGLRRVNMTHGNVWIAL